MVDKKLVNCIEKYWDFVRVLRNTNIGFVEQVNITSEQQNKYMAKHSDNYKICLVNNVPAGFIGIVDNDIRFALFAKVALDTLKRLYWKPDVIVCSDWQMSFVPQLLKENYSGKMDFGKAGEVAKELLSK